MSSCTTIDLLRHGHCEDGNIFRGHWDSALSAKGQQQMQEALNQHQGWQSISSSPLQRCSQFAQETSRTLGLGAHTDYDNFKEISFGDWEGQVVAELMKTQNDQIEKFWADPQAHPPPNGETLEHFNARVVRQWRKLCTKHKQQHHLLISHGGVIRCILAEVLGMGLRPISRLSVPHACISRIQIFHEEGKTDWPQLIFHRPL